MTDPSVRAVLEKMRDTDGMPIGWYRARAAEALGLARSQPPMLDGRDPLDGILAIECPSCRAVGECSTVWSVGKAYPAFCLNRIRRALSASSVQEGAKRREGMEQAESSGNLALSSQSPVADNTCPDHTSPRANCAMCAKPAAAPQGVPPAAAELPSKEDGDDAVVRLGIDVPKWAAEIRERVKAATPAPKAGQRWRDTATGERRYNDGKPFTLVEHTCHGWEDSEGPGEWWPDGEFTNGRLTYVDTPPAPARSPQVEAPGSLWTTPATEGKAEIKVDPSVTADDVRAAVAAVAARAAAFAGPPRVCGNYIHSGPCRHAASDGTPHAATPIESVRPAAEIADGILTGIWQRIAARDGDVLRGRITAAIERDRRGRTGDEPGRGGFVDPFSIPCPTHKVSSGYACGFLDGDGSVCHWRVLAAGEAQKEPR